MSLSLYDASITPFIRGLKNLSTFLEKGRAHAHPKDTELAAARLFPDMGNLSYQVQRVSDTSKGLAVRVAQIENVVMEDNETTFAELQERIQKTIAFLETVKREDMDGKEELEVVMKTQRGELKFNGKDYVLLFGVPNFYFHLVTAYDILRKEGVPVGKRDFLGGN